MVLQLSCAGDAYEHTRRSRGADAKRRFSAKSPQTEIFTFKKLLAQHRLRILYNRRYRNDRILRKINTGDRLIDLQSSGPAGLGVNAVPVV